jgi:hypothetical protein
VDGVGGVIGTLITDNFLILLPVVLFVVIIYFIAKDLDLQKYAERIELMKYTEDSSYELRQQELGLLGSAQIGKEYRPTSTTAIISIPFISVI